MRGLEKDTNKQIFKISFTFSKTLERENGKGSSVENRTKQEKIPPIPEKTGNREFFFKMTT